MISNVYEGINAYKTYLAIRNHFNTDYDYFKYNGKIIDIKNFDVKFLDIFSREVLDMIKNKNHDWDQFLPKGIPEIIKKNQMFGY